MCAHHLDILFALQAMVSFRCFRPHYEPLPMCCRFSSYFMCLVSHMRVIVDFSWAAIISLASSFWGNSCDAWVAKVLFTPENSGFECGRVSTEDMRIGRMRLKDSHLIWKLVNYRIRRRMLTVHHIDLVLWYYMKSMVDHTLSCSSTFFISVPLGPQILPVQLWSIMKGTLYISSFLRS